MSQENLKTRVFNYITSVPLLWFIFEKIFGADNQKRLLYRSAFIKKPKILDFGCSIGNTTLAFKDFEYLGVDIDEKAINYARKKWSKYTNISFRCEDILGKNTVPKKFFDYVLFAGTGHHISNKEIIPIFNELLEKLKKNGELWFFDILKPTNESPLSARMLAKIDRGKFIRSYDEYKRLIKSLRKARVLELNKFPVRGTFFNQEDYCFFRLKKK